MYNYFNLIGKVKEISSIVSEHNNPDALDYKITLTVFDDFKNAEGQFESQDFDIYVSNLVANLTQLNDNIFIWQSVGIRGRIIHKDGNLILVAHNILFFSKNKKEEEESNV